MKILSTLALLNQTLREAKEQVVPMLRVYGALAIQGYPPPCYPLFPSTALDHRHAGRHERGACALEEACT